MTSKSADLNETGTNSASRKVAERNGRGHGGSSFPESFQTVRQDFL